MKYIIGKEFSPDPAGRYYSDGDASGEQFREDVLKPLINKLGPNEVLTVNLDEGVEGYGSSFLSEAFGGLVKFGYFEAKFLLERLSFEYSNPDFEFYEKRIKSYISSSKFNSSVYTPTSKGPHK